MIRFFYFPYSPICPLYLFYCCSLMVIEILKFLLEIFFAFYPYFFIARFLTFFFFQLSFFFLLLLIYLLTNQQFLLIDNYLHFNYSFHLVNYFAFCHLLKADRYELHQLASLFYCFFYRLNLKLIKIIHLFVHSKIFYVFYQIFIHYFDLFYSLNLFICSCLLYFFPLLESIICLLMITFNFYR